MLQHRFRVSRRVMVLAGAVVAVNLAGCATGRLPVNYSPSSVMTAEGRVAVSSFAYLPARDGKVKPFQIRNTAIGSIYVEQDIDVFYKDAVFKELRFVGIKLDSNSLSLGGEIQEFLIDDLGYSVDWTLKVRYMVTATDGSVKYDQTHTIERNTAKFANVFGALNETIKLNVESLLKDQEFIAAVEAG